MESPCTAGPFEVIDVTTERTPSKWVEMIDARWKRRQACGCSLCKELLAHRAAMQTRTVALTTQPDGKVYGELGPFGD